MPLRLMIVSVHRESMGGAYIQEFKSCGGSIGRSLECDWPLPDSKRYISSKHAMIDFQGGCYYIVDLSRNGIYINGSDKAVGNGNPQRLFDGDTIRLGEYEIQVAIFEDEDDIESSGIHDSVIRAQLVGEDLSVETPLLPEDEIKDDSPLAEMLTPSDISQELSCVTDISSAKLTMLNDAANHGVQEAAELFLKSAGLDPDDFRGMNPRQLLENAAYLLSSFATGTNGLLNSGARLREQLNVPNRDKGSQTNPLRGAGEYSTALRLLLGSAKDERLSGPAAVDAAFDELRHLQQAVVKALNHAAELRSSETETAE
ncbi:MAG: type VI secretion system-associated FHA domain protein [Gammaproteobacteria bacterium]